MQSPSLTTNSVLSSSLYNRPTFTAMPDMPAGIIPMHNHPRPTMPQETQRRWNALANVGVGLSILAATASTLSSISSFEKLLQRRTPPKTWQWLTKNGTKKLAFRGWQFVGLAGLLQGINRFETAANTNQPSKVVGALLNTAQMLGFMALGGAWWLLATTFVKGAFLYAGEKNDIENSNHPDRRREWDLSRINKPLLNGQFDKLPKELASASRFVWQDVKATFAFEHWRSLFRDLTHPKKGQWLTPQSYQSALGTQSSLIAFLLTSATEMIPGIPNVISKPMKWLNYFNNGFGALIPQTPLFMRAWQNRDQLDGKLVILGSPLIVLGRVFQMTDKIPMVKQLGGGVGPVGDSVKGKGLALNSQKYLALLNEMRNLQIITERDPYVSATTILNMMATSPDVMDRLRQEMGQPRLDFLIKLLKEAQLENQKTGQTLNRFLEPILEIQDHDHMPFPTTQKKMKPQQA